MVREILHIDIRDFCIVLERQRRPDLREWPVVVAPGQGRTVVQAVSPEAREEGIHPGMVVARARQYCRRLTVLPPDFSLYRQAQEKIVTALGRFSPLVEPASLGHFFVDATGTRRLWGGLLDRADLMRRLVDTEFQLDTAVGVASNKLVSRVASRVVKARELCDVFPGLEASFLAPLAVNVLPGVGEVTTARLLAELNLQTAGELAHVSPMLLSQIFGAVGQRLRSMALGEDPSPVLTPKAAPMLREEVQLPEDDNHRHRLLGYLYGLVEALGRRLRSQNRCPGELALTATYADGFQARARERLAVAGCEFHLDSFLYEAALRLFTQAVQRRIRLRRLSLNVAHLQTPFGQLALFPWDDPGRGKEVKLLRAIDQVRHRFGNEVLYYGRTKVRRQTTDDRGRRSEIRRRRNMQINSAKELTVYQEAYNLAMEIFEISKQRPPEEKYSLIDQVRRSSRSVCTNLREAWSKRRYKAHFVSKLTDSDGENSETDTWLDFARDCKYLEESDHARLTERCISVGKMLGSMLNNPTPFLRR